MTTMMKTRTHSKLAWGFVSLCLSLLATSTLAADRPNILIITVDDMSADSLGCYGCPLKGTSPRIDQLAKQCLRFEYAHVQVGNCMPSRNVMWSGRYPHNNGVEGFFQVRKPTYPVLAEIMAKAGYFTGIRHKVGHSTPYSPFPAWDLVLDKLSNGKKAHVKDASSYGLSVERCIAAAREQQRPFCLLINVADPHKPFYAQNNKTGGTIPDKHVPSHVFTPDEVPIPGFLFDDPVVRKELAHYYSSVRRADDCVGAALDALVSTGELEKTVILFLSDHGMPLPFAKTQLYHHSTRTPLMVRWPGVTDADTIDRTHMVSAVDLLPTLLDIVGIEPPNGLDGRSFASLLRGEQQANREFVVKEYNENIAASRDPMRGIQTKRYLYLFNPWSNGTRIMATATTGTPTYRRMKQLATSDSSLAARHHLYQHRLPEELYDVQNDPDCVHNLIANADHENQLARLRRQLEQWMVETNDPLVEAFRRREDAEFREAVVQRQEAIAMARKKRNKKPK